MPADSPIDYFALDIKALRLTEMNGYLYFYKPRHPLAAENGMVSLQRHIMSVQLKRWLTSKEIVVFANGNQHDTRPDNLMVMSRAQVMKLNINHPPKVELICSNPRCRNSFTESPAHAQRRQYCSTECAKTCMQKFEISAQELEQLVWEMPTQQVAKLFGVSDKAIEKRCKKLGIVKPPRGYWAKLYAGQRDPTVDRELEEIGK